MTFELDMVVDADATEAPLGKAIGFCRQRIEVGPIELFEEDQPGDTESPDRALIIELAEQLANRRNSVRPGCRSDGDASGRAASAR